MKTTKSATDSYTTTYGESCNAGEVTYPMTESVSDRDEELHYSLCPGGASIPLPSLKLHECMLIFVEGTYDVCGTYKRGGYADGNWRHADAAYSPRADDYGVTQKRYGGFHVLRAQIREPLVPVAEDGSAHRYTYFYVATGHLSNVSMALSAEWSRTRGTPLSVTMRRASDAEILRYAPQVIAERERAISDETHRYEHRPHLEEDEWIGGYAAKNKDELLKRREDILKAWEKYHHDTRRLAALKERSPETYRRAAWEVKALAIAEKLYAETSKAVEQPRETQDVPSRKQTQDEWLARQLRHRAHLAKRSAAYAEERLKAVGELEGLGLPPDEHERRLAVLDEIYADPDPQREAFHGKQI